MDRGQSSEHKTPKPTYVHAQLMGKHLRMLRERQGLTTSMLAARIGCTQQQVSAVELGVNNTPIETLATFARALGVSLKSLLALPDPGVSARPPAEGSVPLESQEGPNAVWTLVVECDVLVAAVARFKTQLEYSLMRPAIADSFALTLQPILA